MQFSLARYQINSTVICPESGNVISKVTAISGGDFDELIYEVSESNRDRIRHCFAELGVLFSEQPPYDARRKFNVIGINSIAKSLTGFRKRQIIDEVIYQKIVKNFPDLESSSLL